MPKDALHVEQPDSRTLKRGAPNSSTNKAGPSTYPSSLLSYATSKRSKANKHDKNTSTASTSTKSSANLLLNNNKEPSDPIIAEQINNGETQKSYLGLSSIYASSSRPLIGIKEEGANIDGPDRVDGVTPKPSRSSYIPQSEHVVIPTDPSLMQGKNTN